MADAFDAIVIGGGQAGLAAGYLLRRARIPFVILERSSRIGDVWRDRWDSLRLFTPAAHSSLPGLDFPAAPDQLPTKDEVADYLKSYAATFELPDVLGCSVTLLEQTDNGFRVHTAAGDYRAANVIVATGPFQRPLVPAFADRIDASLRQVHSSAYRDPSQIPDGPTLVVGAQGSFL